MGEYWFSLGEDRKGMTYVTKEGSIGLYLPRQALSSADNDVDDDDDDDDDDEIHVEFDMMYFEAFSTNEPLDDDHYDRQQAGAYIFRPANRKPISIRRWLSEPSRLEISYHDDYLVHETRVVFADWARLTLRIIKAPGRLARPRIQLDWLVGPVPLHSWLWKSVGKETILRMTMINKQESSSTTFYTDTNSAGLAERIPVDDPDRPVSVNWYPMTSAACIPTSRDQGSGGDSSGSPFLLCLLTDRAQAAGAQVGHPGTLDVLVHRRLLHDDDRGVGEPLTEDMCGGNPSTSDKNSCPSLVAKGTFQLLLVGGQGQGQDGGGVPTAAVLRAALQHSTAPLFMTRGWNEQTEEKAAATAGGGGGGGDDDDDDDGGGGGGDVRVHAEFLPEDVHLLSLEPASSSPAGVLLRFLRLDAPVIPATTSSSTLLHDSDEFNEEEASIDLRRLVAVMGGARFFITRRIGLSGIPWIEDAPSSPCRMEMMERALDGEDSDGCHVHIRRGEVVAVEIHPSDAITEVQK